MRETEILVEQQPPQGFLVCDHAGLEIITFSVSHQGSARTSLTALTLAFPRESSPENATSVPAGALLQRRSERAGVVLAHAVAFEEPPTSDADRACKRGSPLTNIHIDRSMTCIESQFAD